MMAEAMSAPLLEAAALDLEAATRITYRLEQSFCYSYDEPVACLRQRLFVVPPRRHGDLHRRHHALDVRGALARQRVRCAGGGNTVVHVRADHVAERIEFHLAAVLERVGDGPATLPASAVRDPWWLAPTPLTSPDERLRAWAGELRTRGERPRETAERVCAAVHEAMMYEFGVTTSRTPAAAALAGGRGVCQDYAHIMITLCRLLGVPARYVSGHLIGQGGTHAWVEVVEASGAGAVAWPFDACNGRPAGRRHVTIATGRDYSDVAPTAGTYVGAPTGRLTTSRRLGVIGLDG